MSNSIRRQELFCCDKLTPRAIYLMINYRCYFHLKVYPQKADIEINHEVLLPTL